MDVFTRFLAQPDAPVLLELYRKIASHPRSFARNPEELSLGYIELVVARALSAGVGIAAVDRGTQELIGFIFAHKPGPKVFDHVLSGLTIGVHPHYQSQGIGRRLFLDFLEHVQTSREDISRVELLVRESNQRAIAFYESIGFRQEGSLENRIRNANGEYEADIPMGWLKPRS